MAQKNIALNVVSVSLGALTTALAFTKRVISEAQDSALASNAFASMREEYQQRLTAVQRNTVISKEQQHTEMHAIEREFKHRRDEKLQAMGLNHFSKAWELIKPDQRINAAFFATVSGVIVGGITYAIGRAIGRNKSSGKSASTGDHYDGASGGGWVGSDHGGSSFGHVFGDCGGIGGDGGGCGL